jgi:hypothetical protein
VLQGIARFFTVACLAASACFVLLATRPAVADCVSCDVLGYCIPDTSSAFCSCSIRYIYGSQICAEKEPHCAAGCTGAEPDSIRTLPIAKAGFASLVDKEPLLGLMLAAAVVPGPNQSYVLALEPWEGAIIRRGDVSYRNRGMFFSAHAGSVPYLFVVDNLSDGSSITYHGLIGNDGRSVIFKKVFRATATDPAVLTTGTWTSAD